MADKTSFRFKLPSPKGQAEIIRDLRLSTTQANELDVALRHISADLCDAQEVTRRLGTRKDRVARLTRIKKALFALEEELARSGTKLREVIPSASLEALGRASSYTAMEKAVGGPLPTRGLAQVLAEDNFTRVAEIEGFFDFERGAIGLKYGPALLAHLLASINEPIRAWFLLNGPNRGGRPSNPERQHVIGTLAEASRNILGRRATATAGGRFQRLCAAVFDRCGLDSTGLTEAVERVLTKRQGRAKAPRP
jgi:hypothetical protein